MQRTCFTIVVLASLVLAGNARALFREEVITKARLFTAIEWSIADTARALHDSPSHRYWETGACNRHSPIVEWIQTYQASNWTGTFSGAPYAYGGRQTPSEATTWVADSVAKAIGLCSAQWEYRYFLSKHPFCFAGCVDCVAVAGFATGWRDWLTKGTQDLLAAAQGDGSYYIELCSFGCPGLPGGYEMPREGDLLVKGGSHVLVWVEGSSVGWSTIIEGTGNADYERAVERTAGGFEDWKADGYTAISVRGILENPRCAFREVRCPSPGVVEWTTGWTHDTWGFAVTVSQDGQSWQKIGEYVRAPEPDTDAPRTWTWRGPLPATGFVRVVEIEAGTQRVQQSPQVLNLGDLARR